MYSNSRIVLNTAVIYMRLIFAIVVSLFSTRYILIALGESDFGIYNLIAGVVALFAFISNTMAGTTQRFVSYNMGSGNIETVKKVFYNSCIIHLFISLIVVILVESIGLYLVNHVLSIPVAKLSDAKFVLHCVTFGLVFTIVTVPYEAVLMAHENIIFVSLVNIFNYTVRLIGAILLLNVNDNRLRLYAFIMACIPLMCFILQALYCRIKYVETKYKWHRLNDLSLIKEMSTYAGWVIIGVTCGTIRTQGAAMLLNIFYGVLANAANGIAMQVNGLLQQFSASITTSIRPQLVKSTGENNINRMLSLTYAACKYPTLLLLLFGIPLVITMPYVLELWLKVVPDNTVIFCRLLLLSLVFSQLTMGLTIAIEATGRVKTLHLVVGLMHVISIPIAYFLFKLGAPPQTVYLCIIGEEILAATLRLILSRRIIHIDIIFFLKHIVIRILFIIFVVGMTGVILWYLLPENFVNLFLLCIGCVISFILALLVYGLDKTECRTVMVILRSGYNKIRSII